MKILMYLLWLVAWLKSRRFRRANGLNDRSRKLPRSKRTMGLQVGLGKIRRFWKQRPRILQFHLVQCSLLLRCNLREDHSRKGNLCLTFFRVTWQGSEGPQRTPPLEPNRAKPFLVILSMPSVETTQWLQVPQTITVKMTRSLYKKW